MANNGSGGRPVIPIFGGARKRPRMALFGHPNNKNSSFMSRDDGGSMAPKQETNAYSSYGQYQTQQHQQFTAVGPTRALDSQQGIFVRQQEEPPRRTSDMPTSYGTYGNTGGPAMPQPQPGHMRSKENFVWRGPDMNNLRSAMGNPGMNDNRDVLAPTGAGYGCNPIQIRATNPPIQISNNNIRAQTPIGAGENKQPAGAPSSNFKSFNELKNRSRGGRTEVDKSLRILTGTPGSVKQWAMEQISSTMTLLFEIFGQLDSNMPSTNEGTAEFVIKDSRNNFICCVFYEIDRKLPHLVRGQWHRVVGTYDSAGNRFRCVSVRPATAMERRAVDSFISISDKALRNAAAHMQEQ